MCQLLVGESFFFSSLEFGSSLLALPRLCYEALRFPTVHAPTPGTASLNLSGFRLVEIQLHFRQLLRSHFRAFILSLHFTSSTFASESVRIMPTVNFSQLKLLNSSGRVFPTLLEDPGSGDEEDYDEEEELDVDPRLGGVTIFMVVC